MQANGVGTAENFLSAYRELEALLEPSRYDPSPFNTMVADFAAKYLRENPWLKERAKEQLRETRGGMTHDAEEKDHGVNIGAAIGEKLL